ncbi:phosphoketolase family protein [Streptomyces sp. NPDC003688]
MHCARGAGIWEWAGTGNGGEPDVALACAGDVPTQEVLAAAQLLRRHLPELARARHHDWIRVHGTDLPEVAEWSWDS